MIAYRLLFQSCFRCISLDVFQLCYWYVFVDGYFLYNNTFLLCHQYAQSNPVRNTDYSQLVFFLNDQHLIQSAFYTVQVNKAKKQMSLEWLHNNNLMKLYHAVFTFHIFQNQVSFPWTFLYCQNLGIFCLSWFSLEKLL